jgi:hypothetical protein
MLFPTAKAANPVKQIKRNISMGVLFLTIVSYLLSLYFALKNLLFGPGFSACIPYRGITPNLLPTPDPWHPTPDPLASDP